MEAKMKHVLLVEDEAAHAELIELAFESRGDIRLTVATSLEGARADLAASTPNLVILDSLLPDGRGMELLHGDRRGAYPVILLTSHADQAMAAEAMAAGVVQYVVKSELTLLQMPRIVDAALRHHATHKPAEPAGPTDV